MSRGVCAMKIPRQKMTEQDPKARIKNFDEVPRGFTPEQARAEASRCLQCKNAPCRSGCPVEIDIPAFILKIREGDFAAAREKLLETNSLPAVCGRVCPQEDQCEKVCVLAKKGEPVAIGTLERFAADWKGEEPSPSAGPEKAKVAVIGAGPAGLTAAADLARMGYRVTIFEALHQPGGVLVYGIPEFRLPKSIVFAEVEKVKKMGVELELDQVVGATLSLEELFDSGFQAVFVGTGAGLPRFMGIPGENLNGVYSANEYLTRVNLMKAYRFPEYDTPVIRGKKVGVIGGGNVAMDSARTALRLGADEVLIVYRRSRAEAPARVEEVHHAEQEGVIFRFLTLPLKYLDDGKGWIKGMECQRMELGEPDDSGRRRPVPIEGSEFTIDCDLAVVAIGNDPNPLLPRALPELKLGRKGTIETDPETGATSIPGVFAGGDIATGAATVIEAMGAGKKAARGIDRYLSSVRG
jgi:glutamate synthase (NADPH) small chain